MEKSLFIIQEEYLAIMRELEDNGGEVTPELEELMRINETELEKKASSYIYIINMLKSKIELADKEIERINKFKQDKQKQIDKLEGTLLQALLLFGKEDKLSPKQIAEGKIPVKRLEIGTIRLSTRRSVSTEIFDKELISEEFKKRTIQISKLSKTKLNKLLEVLRNELNISENIKVDEEISKSLIKDHIDRGFEVDGARLQTNYFLTIK